MKELCKIKLHHNYMSIPFLLLYYKAHIGDMYTENKMR